MKRTLTAVLEMLVDRKLSDLRVSMPAKVVAYNSTQQRASVEPLLRQRTVDGVDNTLPIISDVPVFMPRASGFKIHIPVQVGDIVTIFFADYSIDEWLENGQKATNTDIRTHSLNDCYAVPITNYWSEPISGFNSTDFGIGNGDTSFIMTNAGVVNIIGDVNVTGTVTATVDCVGGGKSLKGHTHNFIEDNVAGVPKPTGAPN